MLVSCPTHTRPIVYSNHNLFCHISDIHRATCQTGAIGVRWFSVVAGSLRKKKRFLMWASSFAMKNTLEALTTWNKSFWTSFEIICSRHIFWVFCQLKLHFSLHIVFSWFSLVFLSIVKFWVCEKPLRPY